MKASLFTRLFFLTTVILFIFGCSQNTDSSDTQIAMQDSSDSSDDTPSWVPENPSNGPWKSNLYLSTSEDGLSFSGKELLVEHVGVPNLLLTSSGELIADYQYFSYEDEDLFGVIGYSVSEDDGKTWTDPKAVVITGLPEATTSMPTSAGEVSVLRAVDPTLVQLSDGSLRLYFTYQAEGESYPQPASALNADGDITGTFVYEGTILDSPEEAALLDPSVVYFNGLWHYYTWNVAQEGIGGSPDPSTPQDVDNYHGTSEDGITFTLEDPVTLDMGFLGQAVVVDGGLRFYGTGTGGIVSAFSSDGYTFVMDEGNRLQAGGGDPGVAQLDDGTFVMIYTGPESTTSPPQ